MGDKTGIEWTHSQDEAGVLMRGATLNISTGCVKKSQGCKNCYAERLWPRLANNKSTAYYGRKFTDIQTHPGQLLQALRWTRPRRIFINSMSDLFLDQIPFEFITEAFAVMARARQHTFIVLTKRPERMLDWITHYRTEDGLDAAQAVRRKVEEAGGEDFPFTWPIPNVWLGVSVEDQDAVIARIPVLTELPAAVRWISAEPLLGPVDIRRWLKSSQPGSALDWVVVGAESGQKSKIREMDLAWARDLLDQCRETGVGFFMKQIIKKGKKQPFDMWPDDLKVRQSPTVRGEGEVAVRVA